MGHNPSNEGFDLGGVGVFSGPNLLVLTRSERPPVASLDRKLPGRDVEKSVEVPGSSRKQEIRGKSVKSSLNLARVLSSLDWSKNGECLHLSLTYHDTWPGNGDELKKRKAQLVCDLGRRVEAGLWMLEYQKRMVPHFHALVWMGGRDSDEFAVWLGAWWAKFAQNGSEFASKITLGDQSRGTWYLAMHAAKRSQCPDFAVGRWWGYINRKGLLGAQDLHKTGTVCERGRVKWARLYRKATGGKVRNSQGFTWFLPHAWQCKAGAWVRDSVEAERLERNRGKNPF